MHEFGIGSALKAFKRERLGSGTYSMPSLIMSRQYLCDLIRELGQRLDPQEQEGYPRPFRSMEVSSFI